MRTWVLPVSFALGLGTALADDPPGYARALIGHVTQIVPEGLIVEGVNLGQLHLGPPPPGVDHACFAGVGGSSLVRGVPSKYRVGDPIEIMVTIAKGDYTLTVDPSHPLQMEICDLLNESLAFPVNVDWDPNPSSNSASTAPVTTAPSPPSSPSSGFNPGSIDDDPLPPAHK